MLENELSGTRPPVPLDAAGEIKRQVFSHSHCCNHNEFTALSLPEHLLKGKLKSLLDMWAEVVVLRHSTVWLIGTCSDVMNWDVTYCHMRKSFHSKSEAHESDAWRVAVNEIFSGMTSLPCIIVIQLSETCNPPKSRDRGQPEVI